MRDDLSNKLIHLTKGGGPDDTKHREDAAFNLYHIMDKQMLLGCPGCIKGKFYCVCFTEAPISKLSIIFSNKNQTDYKYQPYGVMVDKKWLYSKGGRPVIYGHDSEYDLLPDAFKYRHVRFDLGSDPIIDFTWEREWRIRTDYLDIQPEDVTIIVPDRKAISAFPDSVENRKWHFIALSDLGVDVNIL